MNRGRSAEAAPLFFLFFFGTPLNPCGVPVGASPSSQGITVGSVWWGCGSRPVGIFECTALPVVAWRLTVLAKATKTHGRLVVAHMEAGAP